MLCERFFAVSLVDLSNIEIYRLVVWHSQIPPEILKCRDFEYYWLCVHFISLLLFSFQTICIIRQHKVSPCVVTRHPDLKNCVHAIFVKISTCPMTCLKHAGYLLFPQQLTVRHIHKAVHKHLMQTLCHLFLRHALLQNDL